MFAPEIIRKSLARYKHGQLLDFSIEWTWIGRLISWKNVSNLGSEWPKPHEGHKDCYLPEEAFPMRMHLVGLAGWHQEKSILKHAENNAKNCPKKYLKRINNPNPFFYSKSREGSGIQNVQKSPAKYLRAEVGSDFFALLPPAAIVSTSLQSGFVAWKRTTSIDSVQQKEQAE